jgi:hypothetical protein
LKYLIEYFHEEEHLAARESESPPIGLPSTGDTIKLPLLDDATREKHGEFWTVESRMFLVIGPGSESERVRIFCKPVPEDKRARFR